MTDAVTAKLAEWEALTGAATDAPWVWQPYMRGGATLAYPNRPYHEINVLKTTDDWPPTDADAEFIAAAREMVPALLGFVREVRKGHEPEPEARTFDPLCCARCREEWPCPTEQAAQKWLGGEG